MQVKRIVSFLFSCICPPLGHIVKTINHQWTHSVMHQFIAISEFVSVLVRLCTCVCVHMHLRYTHRGGWVRKRDLIFRIKKYVLNFKNECMSKFYFLISEKTSMLTRFEVLSPTLEQLWNLTQAGQTGPSRLNH